MLELQDESDLDENAVTDDNNCILLSAALTVTGCKLLMHEDDSSVTAIEHYFEQ